MEEFRNYINSIRRDFSSQTLDETTVGNDPYLFFAKWFEEAVGAQLLDPNAMIISTANKSLEVSSRVVYMRDISTDGLVFYTNYSSKKAKDLSENKHIACLFFWGELERQIRIEGIVELLDAKQSDDYFSSRPRESQIGAWASSQSETLDSRATLLERVKFFESKFKDQEVPRPENWGGYLIKPNRFEFWQGRPSRLHDRICLELSTDKIWKVSRLNP